MVGTALSRLCLPYELRRSQGRRTSMPEMAHAGEHHGYAVVVGGLDYFFVADRAAGLDHRSDAGLDAGQHAVGEREERVGSDDRALGQGFGELRVSRGVLRLASGDARGINPAHLAGADADSGEILGIDDGVRLDVLGDAEREFEVA